MSAFHNMSIENSEYVKNLKDEVRTLREDKIITENELELSKIKNIAYEKELNDLREVINELKNKYSKSNEDSHKLDSNHLNNTIQTKNKEIEQLSKENIILKGKLSEVQERIESVVYESHLFRIESNKHVRNFLNPLHIKLNFLNIIPL